MTLSGSTVLLTGASSGIGAALAPELARRGARTVVLVARRVEALEQVAEAVRAAGAEAKVLAADVSDRASIEAAVRRADAETGGLDVVIANAGVGTNGKSVSADELGRVTATNYFGAAWTMLAALDGMRARGRGRVVAVSSLAGTRGLPVGAEYSASKAALDVLCEGLRVQLRGTGVGLTLVRPGFVDTPINKGMKSRPFLVDTNEAARRICRGIERGARDVAFPLPMALGLRLVGLLPGFLFDPLAARLVPKRKR